MEQVAQQVAVLAGGMVLLFAVTGCSAGVPDADDAVRIDVQFHRDLATSRR